MDTLWMLLVVAFKFLIVALVPVSTLFILGLLLSAGVGPVFSIILSILYGLFAFSFALDFMQRS